MAEAAGREQAERRVRLLLNVNGFTPAEAEDRLRKARQLAQRHGLEHLLQPQGQRSAEAAQARRSAEGELLRRAAEEMAYAQALWTVMHDARRERDSEEHWNVICWLGAVMLVCALTALAAVWSPAPWWVVYPLAGYALVKLSARANRRAGRINSAYHARLRAFTG